MGDSDRAWEDAAFNTRHLHNHLDRGGRPGNVRHEFKVKSTMGTHLVKCAALERLQQQQQQQERDSTPSSPIVGPGSRRGSHHLQSEEPVGSGHGYKGSGKNHASRGPGAARRKKSGGATEPHHRQGSGSGSGSSGNGEVVLEIYRLTDEEDGLLGSLRAGNVFEATVVFAGSRKTLGKITRELVGQSVGTGGQGKENHPYAGQDGQNESNSSIGDAHDSSKMDGKVNGSDGRLHNSRSSLGDQASDSDEEEDEDEDLEDDDEDSDDGNRKGKNRRRRAAAFEKNSFRQPKFWFRWQGITTAAGVQPISQSHSGRGNNNHHHNASDEHVDLNEQENLDSHDEDDALDGPAPRGTRVHGSGYLVFANNDCRRFQGTLTSEQLGWNNVKMNGWRTRPQPERDFEICWSGEH